MHCLWIVFVCSLAQLSSWRWGNDDIDILSRGKSDSGLPNDFFWTSDRTRFHEFASRSLWSLKSPVTSNTCTNSLFRLFFRLCRAAVVAGGRESKCTWQILTTQFSATKGNYAANDTNLNMIGRGPNPTKSTYVSPPFHFQRVFKSWVIFDTEVPRKMECRSKLSTFEVAIRILIQVPTLNCVLTCIEGVFSNWLCNPYPQKDLKNTSTSNKHFPVRGNSSRSRPSESSESDFLRKNIIGWLVPTCVFLKSSVLVVIVKMWGECQQLIWVDGELNGVTMYQNIFYFLKLIETCWLGKLVWKRSRREMQNCLFKVLGNNAVSAHVVKKNETCKHQRTGKGIVPKGGNIDTRSEEKLDEGCDAQRHTPGNCEYPLCQLNWFRLVSWVSC